MSEYYTLYSSIHRNVHPHLVCYGNGSTIPACMPLCRQAIMPAQRHEIPDKAGKKEKDKPPTPPQAFGKKGHSLLGRFLHATLTLMLKTPQMSQQDCTPLDSTFVPNEAANCPLSCPKAYELPQSEDFAFLW